MSNKAYTREMKRVKTLLAKNSLDFYLRNLRTWSFPEIWKIAFSTSAGFTSCSRGEAGVVPSCLECSRWKGSTRSIIWRKNLHLPNPNPHKTISRIWVNTCISQLINVVFRFSEIWEFIMKTMSERRLINFKLPAWVNLIGIMELSESIALNCK